MIDYYGERDEIESRIVAGFEKRKERRDRMLKEDVKFKDWILKPNGDMIYKNNEYVINGDRLEESQWIAHMKSKGWVDMNVFIDMYLFALVRAGVEEVKIKIHL